MPLNDNNGSYRNDFDESLCEKLLSELPYDKLLPLTAFFLTSRELYPNFLREFVDETQYGKAIRRLRSWKEFNRFYALQQFPDIPDILNQFVDSYNQACSGTRLEVEDLVWTYEVLDSVINLYRIDTQFLQQEMKGAAIAVGMETRDYSDHTNYGKLAAKMAAAEYRMIIDNYLTQNPDADKTVDLLPEEVFDDFVEVLQKVHIGVSAVKGFIPLDVTLTGFPKKLFYALDEDKRRAIEEDYIGMSGDDPLRAYYRLENMLLNALYCDPRIILWPIQESDFITVRDSISYLPLSRSSIRNRVNGRTKKGRLSGVKTMRGVYLLHPRAFMWKIHFPSISSLRQNYVTGFNCNSLELIATSVSDLPRHNGTTWKTIPEASELKNMPSPSTIRKYIKERRLPIAKALVSGKGEVTVLPYSTIRRIRRIV